MEYKDYSKLLEYIEDDKYVYLIIIRSKGLEDSESKNRIIKTVKELCYTKIVLADVNYRSKEHIVFQNASNKKRHNCIVIRRKYLEDVLYSLGINLEDAIKNNLVFLKTTYAINKQLERKKIKEANIKKKSSQNTQNKKTQKKSSSSAIIPFIESNSKIDKDMEKWIIENEKNLLKKSTRFEVYVAKRLIKAFGNKVKVQQPFVINGKCYYADACIKSKKIIIEVDGGYHNELTQVSRDHDRDDAFKSIGYETIRITNDEVVTKGKVTELINRIKRI